MPEPDFKGLRDRLLAAGIAQRHAVRAAEELRDHYDDLVDAAVDAGKEFAAARRDAARALGSPEDFVNEMASRRELKTWQFRYPQLAVVVYPLACIAVLPAAPLIVGFAHRSTVLRWSTSLLAAGLVTACMLLAMQLSIILG